MKILFERIPKSLFYMFEKYTNVLFLAFITFFMAKFVTVDDFGIISNADAIIAILSIFSFQGLEQLVQREIVKEPQNSDVIIGSALAFKIPGAIVGVLLAFLSAIFIENDKLSYCVLILSGLIIARSLLVLSSSMIANNKYYVFTIVGCSVYVVFFIIKLVSLYLSHSILIISIITVLENLCLVFLYYIFLPSKVSYKINKIKPYFLMYYREGTYLILSGAMIVIYTKTDQLYIARFMSYSDLADYAIALKFLMLYIVPSSIFTLSYVSKLNKRNVEYRNTVKSMFIGSVWVGSALGLICAFTTPYIINFFYGTKFPMAGEYIIGLSFAVPLCFILNSTGRFFVNEGMGKFIFQRSLVALLYNVTSGYFFIKYCGAWGGVIAITSSYAVSAVIVVFCGKKSRNLIIEVFCTNENK